MPHRVRSSPAGPLPKIAATYVRVPIRAWSPPDRFWAGINYSIGYDDSNWSVRLRNPHNLPADSLVVISCWCLRHGRRLQFVVAPRTWPCRRQTPQHVCLSLRRCDLDRNAFEYVFLQPGRRQRKIETWGTIPEGHTTAQISLNMNANAQISTWGTPPDNEKSCF
jgi:hypothetical protein